MTATSIALRLLALLALVAPAAAQLVPPPAIRTVPTRPAFDPGYARILGSNLGLVTTVRIAGVDVPIAANTGTRILAGPLAPRAPGFFSIETRSPLGNDQATIEFTPSLMARRFLGTSLSVRLNAANTGAYVLRATYDPIPGGATVPGIHYLNFIGGGASSVVATGVFDGLGPVELQLLRPYYVGLVGAPITLQAECVIGVEAAASHTNAVQVP